MSGALGGQISDHRASAPIEATYRIKKQLNEKAGHSLSIDQNNRTNEQAAEKTGAALLHNRLSSMNPELNGKLNRRLIGQGNSEKTVRPTSKREAEPASDGMANLTQRAVKEFENLINDAESAGHQVNETEKLRLYLKRWTLVGKALSRWQFCYDLFELIEFDGDSSSAGSTAGRSVEFLFNFHCYLHLKKPILLIEFINKQWANAASAKQVGRLVRLSLDVALESNSTGDLVNGVSHFNRHRVNQQNGAGHEDRSRKQRSGQTSDSGRQGSQSDEDRLHRANEMGKSTLRGKLNLVILIDDTQRKPGRRAPSRKKGRVFLNALDRQKLQRIFLTTIKSIVASNRLGLNKVSVHTRLDLIRNQERKCFGSMGKRWRSADPFESHKC